MTNSVPVKATLPLKRTDVLSCHMNSLKICIASSAGSILHEYNEHLEVTF